MVAIDGRKKGIHKKTAKTVFVVNRSSPNLSGRRTEDTSSLGKTHFSLHGKIYISTFLSWFADPFLLQ